MNVHATGKPTAAIALSALGGVWMLAAGAMWASWAPGSPGGWMWGHGMVVGMAPAGGWPWAAALAGVLVLACAVLLAVRAQRAALWGGLILVASALNAVVGMGGLAAGALGVVGGALALTHAGPEGGGHAAP